MFALLWITKLKYLYTYEWKKVVLSKPKQSDVCLYTQVLDAVPLIKFQQQKTLQPFISFEEKKKIFMSTAVGSNPAGAILTTVYYAYWAFKPLLNLT